MLKSITLKIDNQLLTRVRHLVVDDFLRALDVQHRWQLSFWDSAVVAAAQQAGANDAWSEDLNPGQDYRGVLIVNPLGAASL